MQIPPAPITWNFTSTSTTKGGERGSTSGGDGLYVCSVLDPTTLASTLHMQLPFEAIFRPLPPPSTTSTYHHATHTTTNSNDKHMHIHDIIASSSNVLYSDVKENSYTYNNNANTVSDSTGILQWEEYRSGVMDRYI